MGWSKYAEKIGDLIIHTLSGNIIVSIVISVFTFILFSTIIRDVQYFENILSILLFIFVLMLVIIIRFRSFIKILLDIDKVVGSVYMRKPLFRLIQSRLERTKELLSKIRSEEGAELGRDDVKEITNLLFKLNDTNYFGTDSNPPSKFLELYPEYLESHSELVERLKRRNINPGPRILIMTENDLINDDPIKVLNFAFWHLQHNVPLRRIDPQEAKKLSEKYNLPEKVTDIGIWGGAMCCSI